MSRVLLTGASGFIGRQAIAPLLDAGHEVHAVSRHGGYDDTGLVWHRADMLSSPKVVEEIQPELLLHFAWYAEHGKFWDSPLNVRWVEASLAMLRAFAAGGGRRVVLAGSCAEYDWSAVGDTCHEESTPRRPVTLYGAAKHSLHELATAYAAQAGFELAWGRVFFLFGPDEPPARLVPAVARAVLAGEPARTTAGTQVRDFMHVADVAAAFAALLGSAVSGPVNIASGEALELRELIGAVAAAAGDPGLVELGALPTREGEPERLVADVGRLRNEVGWAPTVARAERIEQTVAWWRAQPPPAI